MRLKSPFSLKENKELNYFTRGRSSGVCQLDRLTFTYALIKSLYEQGEDYVDSFWPFAIKVFPTDRSVDSHFIQQNLKQRFDLEIPLHALTIVLGRAKDRGHIEREERQYKLTSKGLTYLDAFEADKDVERRINALLEDMRKFFETHGIQLTTQQVHETLMSFLQLNIQPLIQFLSPSHASIPAIKRREARDAYLLEYVETVEESKPEHWKTFQDMVLGSIISVVLNAERVAEISEAPMRGFKNCEVFLDANFVFSILDLHSPEFNEPAKELYDLLKTHAFRLKVFSFTVDEICRVINGYSTQAYRYPIGIRVDSLYSTLKVKGWTKPRAREFITNIDDTLSNKGIQIEWIKDITLEKYEAPDEQIREIIRKYKPLQDSFHQSHDLAAIQKIREMRMRPVRKIEDISTLFLTSDSRLSAFDFVEMKHKENGTVCEVILDRLLTSLLWLKYPKSGLSLKAIIGAHSRDLFVKRRIWDKFYDVLTELRQKGQVTDERISTLFYHNYVEYVLKPLDENNVDEVTPEFVLETIEEAARLPEQEVQRQIVEKEKEFLQRLNEERTKSQQEKEAAERSWLERLQQVKTNIRMEAERSAGFYSRMCSGAVCMSLVAFVYGIYSQIGWAALSLVSFILGGTGVVGIWIKLNNYLEMRFSNRIYSKRATNILKGLELHDNGAPEKHASHRS